MPAPAYRRTPKRERVSPPAVTGVPPRAETPGKPRRQGAWRGGERCAPVPRTGKKAGGARWLATSDRRACKQKRAQAAQSVSPRGQKGSRTTNGERQRPRQPPEKAQGRGGAKKIGQNVWRMYGKPVSLHRFLTESLSLDYGVMVAQQVLVLFVQVRILVVQRTNALRKSFPQGVLFVSLPGLTTGRRRTRRRVR